MMSDLAGVDLTSNQGIFILLKNYTSLSAIAAIK